MNDWKCVLDKSVCIECKEWFSKHKTGNIFTDADRKPFLPADEWLWNQRHAISCPCSDSMLVTQYTDVIPKDCPHKDEHKRNMTND